MTPTDRVLISTHDLPKAGELRDAFEQAGYATDLVTPSERLTADPDAALLVLTSLDEEAAVGLARQGREALKIPVFAISPEEELPPALRPGFDEVFAHSASVDDIVLLGSRSVERRKLRELTGIVGRSDAIQQVLERVVQIAPVQSTVLVTGESGTGKELVARGIHALSPRRHKSFIAVNVAALSETLLESEIFGHEKGAFTGAIDSRKGLFELADGGTIFLDEIGEMPLATQTKLLRVLEQREFLRVGGEKPIRVDVRIIAATNQDLRQLVAIGEFRRDLFFRLNVLSIELPPLRERREDLPLLVESFVREVSERNQRTFPGISADAMEVLAAHSWPGNVRELRNLVESMVVLAPNRAIRPEDIPDDVRRGRGASLLPVRVGREEGPRERAREGAGEPSIRPELEFIFRTLVELRVDMDELRREFEVYRSDRAVELGPYPVVGRVGSGVTPSAGEAGLGIEVGTGVHGGEAEAVVGAPADAPVVPDPSRVIVFEPGMTMEDMERRAIVAALHEVGGNRRKAADLLGIGERTLYRKIAKYGLDL